MAKLEGKVERWWITSNLIFGPVDELCGDFYGLEEIGLPDGEFGHINHLLRIDFINEVCETEEAFIKLGKRADINEILAKMASK